MPLSVFVALSLATLAGAAEQAPRASAAADASVPKQTNKDNISLGTDSSGQFSPDRLPPFSWEYVPRYMHIRKDTAFTTDEIRYLASFPLVTFEKSTGAGQSGSTEDGTVAAARAVKAISPATKILYYRNVIVHYGGYAANASLTKIPVPFLVGRDGRDTLVRNRVQAYDLSHTKVREWWLASTRQVCAEASIDGLFLDGNIKVLEPAYLRQEIGEKKKAALVESYTAMMNDTRRILGPEKLMVANVLRARFPDSGLDRLRAFDGSYVEAFETTVGGVPLKDYVAKGIAAFQESARQGFLIAFTGGLGEEESDEGAKNQERTDEIRKALPGGDASTRRFQYLLAIFLICAEKHSYFCAHDGYDAKKSTVWMKHPPEFARPLGAPKGPAVREGYIYKREFAHASVLLDLETQPPRLTGDNKLMNPILTTFLLLATLADLHAADAVSAIKPNIIFILTDDQGYGDVGRHGHPLLKTPHLDALHDQSVRFEKFYVSPSCSPTRAALMTGMHEFGNGVTHTKHPREHLNKHAVILPQLLKTAGYRTGFIGKWHLGGDGEYAPDKRGFDWCSTNVGGPNVHFDPVMVRNRKREPRKGYREDIFFDEAMTFMDETKDAPFFCYLATYSPHAPLAAPEHFVAPFRGKVTDEEAAYLGMVANLDDNLGRLMKYLHDRKLEENTIVIFMNDNGQTHGLDVFNAGMRGSKCTIWQGGSRAMSFWKWPGKWQPHAVNKLTAHLDVLPTLCDFAGVNLPKGISKKLEGFTLRPLLEATKAQDWHEDRQLFHHVGRWPSGMAAAHKYAMASVQTAQYLLVRSQPCDDPECLKYSSQCTTLRSVEKGATRATYTKANAAFHWGVTPRGQWSLFDLDGDQTCQKNLASEKPDLVAKLASAYDQWWDGMFPEMIQYGGDKGEPDKLPKKGAATNH